MSDQGNAPLTLLGSNISYFTGKMENYLRLKQIPYRLESMQFPAERKVLEWELGVMQMPAIILPDGRYMTCLLYTSPSPRDRTRSRMPSSA